MTALSLDCVHHEYVSPTGPVPVLTGVQCAVAPGEVVALTGPSGSGKSTLLSIAGLLLTPTSGTVCIRGVPASTVSERARAAMRACEMGYLFQQANLIRHLTVLENVLVPLLANQRRAQSADALELLRSVGLPDHADALPGTLSGGQAQRVALCRALVNSPALLLADEPTASLDEEAADNIRDLLRTTANGGVAVLLATHDAGTAAIADRVLELRNGSLSAETLRVGEEQA